MFDSSYRGRVPVKELPFLLWFGVCCKNPPQGALWDPNETESLDKLEDDLLATVERWKPGWAAYPLRIATPGLREYYIYVNDETSLQSIIDEVRAQYPNYRIEADAKLDKSWETYSTFVANDPERPC